MNSEEARRLLEKYYNAESTLEEELLLKNFFSQPDIPEDLINESEIFRFYLKTAEVPEPDTGLANKIISALDSLDQESANMKRRKIYGMIAGIAAGLLIMTGSYFFFINKSGPRDTFSDPEIAYTETLKILYDVSSRLNQGTRELDRINSLEDVTRESLETINRSAASFNERMKPLEDLRKAIEKKETGYDRN